MIIPINNEFRPKVNKLIADEWAGPIVITKGILHDTTNSDGFIYVADGELTGYALFEIHESQCEILVLQSIYENRGIGSALLNTIIDVAKTNNCINVWLITTNDNIHAIRFYQKFGFELKEVHINALDKSRRLKPSIPLLGNEGIPLKHEFEFYYTL